MSYLVVFVLQFSQMCRLNPGCHAKEKTVSRFPRFKPFLDPHTSKLNTDKNKYRQLRLRLFVGYSFSFVSVLGFVMMKRLKMKALWS